MDFKVLDLFCGAGAFSNGLSKNSKIEVVIGLDYDKNAIRTFEKNHSSAIAIQGDITSREIKDKIISLSKSKKVNMIVGGPPCQGFSLKGKQLGIHDPRNFLFLEFLEIVEKVKPEVFVMENVKSMLSSQSGYFIKEIKDSFEKIGYYVNYSVLNAKDYGVPQNRERAIIIGSLSRIVSMPKPDHNSKVTVRDAISDLCYLNSGEGSEESYYLNNYQSHYQKKIRGKKLLNHIATNHSKVALMKLSLVPPEGDKSSIPVELRGKQKFATTWSRLKWDDVSPTIDTRFDTPSNGRNSHPILNRAITPREAARIQSFDDDFVFTGPKTSICKQIGNAVPPFLAKRIGEAIISAYDSQNLISDRFSIFLADSFDFYKELKYKGVKVDHIITDPPYNISKDNNFSTMKNPRKGIDFGEWDKKFDYIGWIKDYVSLLNENGSIIIFCSYIYLSYIVEELEKNDIKVKDIILWKKSNPMPRNTDRRYVQDTEFAVWGVVKNSKWVFNKPKNKPYLRSTFETSTVSGGEKVNHPTQKSLKLLEELINIHTNEGQLILDPFMGSGTTGVASLKNNRKFIGIEINENYFSIASERLKKIKKEK